MNHRSDHGCFVLDKIVVKEKVGSSRSRIRGKGGGGVLHTFCGLHTAKHTRANLSFDTLGRSRASQKTPARAPEHKRLRLHRHKLDFYCPPPNPSSGCESYSLLVLGQGGVELLSVLFILHVELDLQRQKRPSNVTLSWQKACRTCNEIRDPWQDDWGGGDRQTSRPWCLISWRTAGEH